MKGKAQQGKKRERTISPIQVILNRLDAIGSMASCTMDRYVDLEAEIGAAFGRAQADFEKLAARVDRIEGHPATPAQPAPPDSARTVGASAQIREPKLLERAAEMKVRIGELWSVMESIDRKTRGVSNGCELPEVSGDLNSCVEFTATQLACLIGFARTIDNALGE